MNNLIAISKYTSILKYIFYVQFTSATDFMISIILRTEISIYLAVRVCFCIYIFEVRLHEDDLKSGNTSQY
jgi:hypothetical protein